MNLDNKRIPSKRTVANLFAITTMFSATAQSMSYISYAFTDLAHIPIAATGVINFTGTVIGMILSFVSGMIIEKVNTRSGKCRPWMYFGFIAGVIGCFIMYSAGLGGGTASRIAIISVGFGMMTIAGAFGLVGGYGLQRIVAGADSEARNLIASRDNIGINGGMVLDGLIILPLATFFGGGIKGFMCMELVMGVVGIIAMTILFKATKGYDLPTVKSESDEGEENVSFLDMLKSAAGNRPALAVFFADIIRFFGYCIWFSLIVYQCKYVIGDMNSMIIVLTATNILGMVGAYLSYYAAKLLKGRKNTILAASVFVIASFIGVGITGGTLWGFVICSSAACFFMSFYDSLTPMMYADAGEYWLHEKGKDTRVYLMSLAGVPMNVAMALSSLGFTGVLLLIHYVPDTAMTAAAAHTLTWTVGLVPAICYAVAFILLKFVHGVSDADMERYMIENEEKGLGMDMERMDF